MRRTVAVSPAVGGGGRERCLGLVGGLLLFGSRPEDATKHGSPSMSVGRRHDTFPCADPPFDPSSDTLRRMKVTLTTTGRRSGQARAVPLYAWEDGDRLVVVGSRGGAASDPDWARNLRAEPRATIKLGRQVRQVSATEVDGAERERLWKLVCEAFPLYASYQRKTKRVIPLFVLETVDGA